MTERTNSMEKPGWGPFAISKKNLFFFLKCNKDITETPCQNLVNGRGPIVSSAETQNNVFLIVFMVCLGFNWHQFHISSRHCFFFYFILFFFFFGGSLLLCNVDVTRHHLRLLVSTVLIPNRRKKKLCVIICLKTLGPGLVRPQSREPVTVRFRWLLLLLLW